MGILRGDIFFILNKGRFTRLFCLTRRDFFISERKENKTMAEQYNYTYTENPYLKEAYAAETAAADAAAIAYQNQANAALAQAKQTQLQANKGATSDYYANINPYGVQAEALGRSGLGGGGLSQSNMIRGYADYTNRLGQAKDAYENARADIDTTILSNKAQMEADKLSSKARYNSVLASDMRQDESDKFDIWQDRQDRQYRQGRDELEDRRYEREWAYNHRKAKVKVKDYEKKPGL